MLLTTVFGVLEPGLAVARKIDADLMAGGSQGARQGAHDVGQSPGFRKWHTFRSSKNDVHESDSLMKCRPGCHWHTL